MTKQRDVLDAERRNMPMVEIEKDYLFDGPDGKVPHAPRRIYLLPGEEERHEAAVLS